MLIPTARRQQMTLYKYTRLCTFPAALPPELQSDIAERLEAAWVACTEDSTFTDWRQALHNPDLPRLLHAPLFCLACYKGESELAQAAWKAVERSWNEDAWQRLEELYTAEHR